MPMLSPVKIDESAELVMSATRADSLAMADFRYKSANFRPLTRCCAPRQARRRIQIVVNMAELLMNSAMPSEGSMRTSWPA